MLGDQTKVLNIIEVTQGGDRPQIVRHERTRAADSGKLDEERRRLHAMREALGLTVYDLVDITGLSYGTVLYNFWSGRSRAPVHPEIRELIESRYADWRLPENVARRQALDNMTMEEIVTEWSRLLGAAPTTAMRDRVAVVADALNVHPLTVERQVDGKRDRWNPVRIFSYEQSVKQRAAALRATGRHGGLSPANSAIPSARLSDQGSTSEQPD